ncbi:hypothetical protein LFLEISCH_11875, partial [Listeria fleischmannii subsp. fleischmannii LU2006-1]
STYNLSKAILIFFEPLIELVQAAKRAVDVLHQQVHFNEETGTYTVAKTFAPAMKSLQDSLQKARGIDPKLDAQLEDYEILAVVYKDNTGKDAVMWVLEKNGVRVQNAKLQKYIEQTGRYQDAEKYTIITLADLDKKNHQSVAKGYLLYERESVFWRHRESPPSLCLCAGVERED